MNQLWCELWEYRKEDLLKLNPEQLRKVLEVTEKYVKNYKHLFKDIDNDTKIQLIKRLRLENQEIMDMTLTTMDEFAK